ncbi:hypothetical protein [Butyricicoccus porcorum]|nr:hypothetical protein [Butyricicoccus porcorum]
MTKDDYVSELLDMLAAMNYRQARVIYTFASTLMRWQSSSAETEDNP